MHCTVAASPPEGFALGVQTLIVGAGACGLIAALAAKEAGQQVLVLEADAIPSGSTALSAGLIPAAGTQLQRQANINDTSADFFADIQAKAKNQNKVELVSSLTDGASVVIEWLMTQFNLPFTLVDNFDYPGHSHRRMHGLPTRSGTELINALRATCEREGIDIVCNRRVSTLHQDGLLITGVSSMADDNDVSFTIYIKRLVVWT